MKQAGGAWRTIAWELVVAVLLIAFLSWLAVQISGERTRGFDIRVRDGVHQLANPALTAAMRVMSFVGEPFIIWPLAAVVFMFFRRAGMAQRAWLFLVCLGGAVGIEQTLKYAIHRPRPQAFFDYPIPTSYSFPSGHAMSTLTFSIALAALTGAAVRSTTGKVVLWSAALLAPGAIGFSRIYLGVHYPTDVIAGYTASLAWLLLVSAGNRVRRNWVQSL